ncbi:MAG: two-component system response regulator NarL [Candidatus Thiodiazotropha sp. (ex Lucina pensylvanica)]|nr:two-component system response regulator NarL [Candidatus Thiodiazotropha sp. (ex Lucina pensylvanica)]MBT3052397.1 two-component system response regulator NarL [Candidatus Thiodiazotropha sp. (ex Codakia orbicularis)]
MNATVAQRIVVIDDHPLLRKGLQQLADLGPDIEIIGEADSGPEGIAMVNKLKPDLVLLDLNMPEMNGLEVLTQLKSSASTSRVVMLTVSNAEEDVVAALRSGADGYLLKDMKPTQLMQKLHEVAEGRVALSPNVAECLARAMQAEGARDTAPSTLDLTDRECEILIHISEGESNKVIARTLSIAESTVKVHVKHLLKKLGLKTRVEAAVWAVTHKDQF